MSLKARSQTGFVIFTPRRVLEHYLQHQNLRMLVARVLLKYTIYTVVAKQTVTLNLVTKFSRFSTGTAVDLDHLLDPADQNSTSYQIMTRNLIVSWTTLLFSAAAFFSRQNLALQKHPT